MTKKNSFGKKFAAPVVSLTIDGQNVQAAQGSTLLEAARKSGVNIPSLCYLREI